MNFRKSKARVAPRIDHVRYGLYPVLVIKQVLHAAISRRRKSLLGGNC
jgi:hypothetical protein